MMELSGKELHDRMTRGGTLSAEETAILEAWYREQDAEELAALSESGSEEDLGRLRRGVEEAVAALQSATQEIQRQLAENDRLRAENATLRQRLPLTTPRA